MAALLQWYLSPIGPTNSVQPYCRFAIITMQMMPTISCVHGWAKNERVCEVESVTIGAPPCWILGLRTSAGWYELLRFVIRASVRLVLRCRHTEGLRPRHRRSLSRPAALG